MLIVTDHYKVGWWGGDCDTGWFYFNTWTFGLTACWLRYNIIFVYLIAWFLIWLSNPGVGKHLKSWATICSKLSQRAQQMDSVFWWPISSEKKIYHGAYTVLHIPFHAYTYISTVFSSLLKLLLKHWKNEWHPAILWLTIKIISLNSVARARGLPIPGLNPDVGQRLRWAAHC